MVCIIQQKLRTMREYGIQALVTFEEYALDHPCDTHLRESKSQGVQDLGGERSLGKSQEETAPDQLWHMVASAANCHHCWQVRGRLMPGNLIQLSGRRTADVIDSGTPEEKLPNHMSAKAR